MEKTIVDILKKIELPIKNLNLFEEQLHKEIELFLKKLDIQSPFQFLQQLTLETSLQKLKSFEFDEKINNYNLLPISKKELKDLNIYYEYYQTKLGLLLIASTDLGICYVAFETSEKPALPYLTEIFSNSNIKKESKGIHQSILEFIEGNENIEIKFHIKGTPFQFDVWNALLKIPKGKLTSYGEIANQINKPKAFRAVGTAIGTNPISLLIPCHRVIQSNGNFGGYMWGLPVKFLLIGWEGLQNRIA